MPGVTSQLQIFHCKPTWTSCGMLKVIRLCLISEITVCMLIYTFLNYHFTVCRCCWIECLFSFSDNDFECSVHLINNGLTIDKNYVVIEYSFTGNYTRCSLDNGKFHDCKFPFLFYFYMILSGMYYGSSVGECYFLNVWQLLRLT